MRRSLLLFAVLAMLAAACSGETADPAPDGAPAPSDDGTPASGAGAVGTIDGGSFDDPRGLLFSRFQASIDRDHPFNTLDAFCLPHDAAANREATDPGITADSIEIHHIRSQLELLADIGFAIPIGDPAKMFEVLVGVINDECGGIRGRTLDLGLSEYNPSAPDLEQQRTATCLEATEDRDSVVVLNSTGFQGPSLLCVAEEHETAFLTTQGVPDEFTDRAEGRLLTLDEGVTESMATMVRLLGERGLLDGKTIGVLNGDNPGEPEAVQEGLINVLADIGRPVTVHAELGCGGSVSCTEGLESAIADFASAGVDVVFPMVGVITLPSVINEMVTQGFAPGDVQFYNSKQNSQDSDLVVSKVVALGSKEAGDLYDGTIVFSSASPNDNGLDGAVSPFQQLCIDTYAANGGTDPADFVGSEDGMLTTVCGLLRVMARAIYDAGDNPTRAAIHAQLADTGPFDSVNMIPMAWTSGDPTAAEVVQTLTFTFPCANPDFAFDENDTCLVPNLDYEEAFD